MVPDVTRPGAVELRLAKRRHPRKIPGARFRSAAGPEARDSVVARIHRRPRDIEIRLHRSGSKPDGAVAGAANGSTVVDGWVYWFRQAALA